MSVRVRAREWVTVTTAWLEKNVPVRFSPSPGGEQPSS